jgi:glycosyltransferase involved in cell wall biosynthesis
MKNKGNKIISKILLITDDVLQLSTAPSSRLFRLGQILNQEGFKVKIMPIHNRLPFILRGNSRKSSYLRRIFLSIQIFKQFYISKINLVYVRGVYIGLVALFFSKFFNRKLFYDFHGLSWKEEEHKGNRLNSLFFKFLEYWVLGHSSWISAQTLSNKLVAETYNKNSLFVGNGINMADFNIDSDPNLLKKYNIDSSNNLIGFIGNWENWMNVEELLDSSKFLEKSKIIIVGEGENLKQYKKKYKNVIFTGRIPHREAIGLLNFFKICISPHSKDKIMIYKSAVKTLEYMAAGKPMIVSDVIGKEDFLVDKKNSTNLEFQVI